MRSGVGVALLLLLATRAHAQEPEQVTFEEAIRRAVTNHPTVQQAAADILRAQAVLTQTRARSLPALDATLNTNVRRFWK